MKTGIIGAGPSGLMCAYALSKRGIQANVFEEHNTIGRPIQCTGIVTKELYKLLMPEKGVVLNHLKNAIIHSKNRKLKINTDDIVIDREKFDTQLARMAESEGVKIHLNEKVKKVSPGNKGFLVKTNKESYIINSVVGANGPESSITKSLNPRLNMRYLTGVQARIRGNFDDDTFHVYLGDEFPGFFGWIVPEDKTTARVGMAAEKNVARHFKEFKRRLKINDNQIIEKQGGLIPMYNPKIKTQKGNIYLVGDAALQVKATTGGGVVPGLKAAKVLAESIQRGKNYEKAWRKEVGMELWAHGKIRKMLDEFVDKDYDKLLEIMSGHRNKKLISKTNRDNLMGTGIRLFLENPTLVRFLPKIM
ncbi:MAG: geranylgeranyl reductase family protein [Candidatus Nanoarchaeia archaeon]